MRDLKPPVALGKRGYEVTLAEARREFSVDRVTLESEAPWICASGHESASGD